METIICTSQADFDSIPCDFDGCIIIKFGSRYNRAVVSRKFKYSVIAYENSFVIARDNSSVIARDNSSVEAWMNSSVIARDNSSVEVSGVSSVEARDNSFVKAWMNSSVIARDNSSVIARDNSSVIARDNSSVIACDNSSVEALGNSQITDMTNLHKIKTYGNARIVYNPQNIEEYVSFYGIESNKNFVKLFKAVHKADDKYYSDYDRSFIYKIGETVFSDDFTINRGIECGHGIHMAHKEWAIAYGSDWKDLAILELEVEKKDVVVPTYGCGKVRAPRAKVIRELPLEECGMYGKILAKRFC